MVARQRDLNVIVCIFINAFKKHYRMIPLLELSIEECFSKTHSVHFLAKLS